MRANEQHDSARTDDAQAMEIAANFLIRVFKRVDRDSAHGRALARALGFTDQPAMAIAAREFMVSVDYLERLQNEVAAKFSDVKPAPVRPRAERHAPAEESHKPYLVAIRMLARRMSAEQLAGAQEEWELICQQSGWDLSDPAQETPRAGRNG
jgi:hypothetical protein